MSFHYFTKHKSSALSAQAEYANLNYFHNGDNIIKKVALRCDRGGYAMYPCMVIVVFYVDRSLIQNIRYNFVSVYHAYKSPNHHISYKMVFVYHIFFLLSTIRQIIKIQEFAFLYFAFLIKSVKYCIFIVVF